jgi:hypothetical protein
MRNFNEPVGIEITVHEPSQELVSFGLLDRYVYHIFRLYSAVLYDLYRHFAWINRTALTTDKKQNLHART